MKFTLNRLISFSNKAFRKNVQTLYRKNKNRSDFDLILIFIKLFNSSKLLELFCTIYK